LNCSDSYNDVEGVLDGHDDSGGELNLLPGVFDVDDVNTLRVSSSGVSGHGVIAVLGSEVDLYCIREITNEGKR
jgi:hypothetical protein